VIDDVASATCSAALEASDLIDGARMIEEPNGSRIKMRQEICSSCAGTIPG